MGMYKSTYFGFGALIALEAHSVHPLLEALEEGVYNEVMSLNSVGYLMAGNYDNDMLFLTTVCEQVADGMYRRVPVDDYPTKVKADKWTFNLRAVATAIEMPLLETPAWFVVPDIS